MHLTFTCDIIVGKEHTFVFQVTLVIFICNLIALSNQQSVPKYVKDFVISYFVFINVFINKTTAIYLRILRNMRRSVAKLSVVKILHVCTTVHICKLII